MSFSAALHAAVITSLEHLPVSLGGPLALRLNVELRSPPPPPPVLPASAEAFKPVPPLPAPLPAPQLEPAAPRQPGEERVTTLPDRYFTARELDVPAVARDERPQLVYPENPFLWKLRGTVRLRVFINENGTVDDVHVVRAEPPGEFEEAAIAAARKLVYTPALRHGRPAKSQKLIEVTFDPRADTPR